MEKQSKAAVGAAKNVRNRIAKAFAPAPQLDGWKRPEGMDRETYKRLRNEKNERLAELGRPRMAWVATSSIGLALSAIKQTLLQLTDGNGGRVYSQFTPKELDALAWSRYSGPIKVNGTYRRQHAKPAKKGRRAIQKQKTA